MNEVLDWMAEIAGPCVHPTSQWELQLRVHGIPQQKNGVDCGPYIWKYMDCLGRGM